MKKVNLVILFQALGYEKEATAKSQKTAFLKKVLNYDEDLAKSTLEVDTSLATDIVNTFIANVKTDAQIKRSELAKLIDLKDDKFYQELAVPNSEDVVKTLKAEIKKLKETIKTLEDENAKLNEELDSFNPYDDEIDEDDEEEEDNEDN